MPNVALRLLTVAIAVLLGVPERGLAQDQGAARSPAASVVQAADSVWLNLNSGVYHCRGSQYYGATVRGRYLSESAAVAAGYRAAYRKSCGASVASPLAASRAPEAAGVRVWVNTSSGVYHCPGTRYYGNTKRGRFTTESDARADGNRPAAGRSCS